MSEPQPKYALLEEVLALRQMKLQPMYTIRDVAALFGVTVRAIQSRVASGQLPSRDLPGRAKFLPVDVEQFLRNSERRPGK
ncbi:MAG TPA: helix-turn-helix domain-containing protein [Acidobacteriaceae bacterium]|nr:helix-turn-helix domain-containing protein [Acidobacteriaceae bacterium]